MQNCSEICHDYANGPKIFKIQILHKIWENCFKMFQQFWKMLNYARCIKPQGQISEGFLVLQDLGPRYPNPGLQAEKDRAHHKYKENIAMTDCLVILYPAWRQSVIAIFFSYLWWDRFFFRLQSGLSISWALKSQTAVQWYMWFLLISSLCCNYQVFASFWIEREIVPPFSAYFAFNFQFFFCNGQNCAFQGLG